VARISRGAEKFWLIDHGVGYTRVIVTAAGAELLVLVFVVTILQVVYSLTPIWAAVLAVACGLPGEEMGPWGWAGGGIILAATLGLAADSNEDGHEQEQQQ
jgi:drug/metabolite transporter (DMT)-like permease